ncbi:ribosome maturation factor RimP [Weissella uvarum]|uniref:ribosome maturation factor n=1 Tax=Weissella uvarum TaxID=1479233 RepID=UPI0019616D2F|nr:ribosome maturation factor [Weissella uvarum]MBM7617577.1 ribosome maturation factor RimP [Weissella uvarum]MCM0595541.1 ribosome maturation factor [Weissella uvarum]
MPEVVEKVHEVLDSALAEKGFDLWDVRYERQDSDMVLRVLVDRLDGEINMDDLVMLTELISDAIDAITPDPFPEAYLLDVSSPGAERELKRPQDFKWALGKTITVTLTTPVNDATTLTGTLQSADTDELVLEVVGKKGKRQAVSLPGTTIKNAHLALDQARVLRDDADFEWALDKFVELSTYRKIDGVKEFSGQLVGYDADELVLLDEADNERHVPREVIAKARQTNTF